MADLRDRLQAALGDAYELERELMPGGMSRLFVATERSLNRYVVVKVLPPEYASEVSAARFQREITLTAHLQHPHILPILSAGSRDGLLYYVVPFIDGESLRQRLDREGKLPISAAVQILREVADALARAHQAGIVHRDIKPENILLQHDHALLADFGIARALHEATGSGRLTDTGTGLGTPGYMAPEQLAGDRHVDARADVYALAVVGYEMLAGTPPFSGNTPQAVAAAHFTGTPKPISHVRKGVPGAVDIAIARALAKDPDQRFTSAAAFRDALPGSAVRATQLPTGRMRWLAAVALGALVIGSVVLAWHRLQNGDDDASAGPVRLAVLPFDNLGDSVDAYFADGITDAVRGKLTAVPELEVTAPVSSLRYRHSAKTPQQVGRELGVRYLVTGRVRWAKAIGGASRVQVEPALIDVTNGADKWEESFDASLADVFQVQADISNRVVGALRVALTPSAQQQIDRRPTSNLEAYNAYLRGRSLEDATSSFDYGPAVAAFSRAVALDSSFALAWAALARVQLWTNEIAPLERAGKDADVARVAALRAVALAPNLSEAHAALGFYYAKVPVDHARALEEFAIGRHLNPHDATLLAFASLSEWAIGSHDASIADREAAARLDPQNAIVMLTLCSGYQAVARYRDAERSCDRAVALEPRRLEGIQQRVDVSLQQGDLAGARAVLHTSLASIDSTALATYFAEIFELGWVLDSTLERVLIREATTPRELQGTGDWYVALAQQYGYRSDSAHARAYADSARQAYAREFRAVARDSVHAPVPLTPNALQHMMDGLAFGYLGQRDSAIAHARIAAALVEGRSYVTYVSFTNAKTYLLLNEPDRALDLLETVVSPPDLRPGDRLLELHYTRPYLRIDRNLARLHGNPRFERLVSAP